MYKGLKSTAATKPSAAKRVAQEREKQRKSGKYAPLAKSQPAKARRTRPSVRIMPLKAHVVQQPPETALSKAGLSMKKLMRNTPNLMVENAKEVKLERYKVTKTRTGLRAITAIGNHIEPLRPDKIKRNHELTVIGLDVPDHPISKQKRVFVSCGCENYVYVWEYANTIHGASKVIYGNGEPPVMTNPRLAYGLCKHSYALFKEIIARGD